MLNPINVFVCSTQTFPKCLIQILNLIFHKDSILCVPIITKKVLWEYTVIKFFYLKKKKKKKNGVIKFTTLSPSADSICIRGGLRLEMHPILQLIATDFFLING